MKISKSWTILTLALVLLLASCGLGQPTSPVAESPPEAVDPSLISQLLLLAPEERISPDTASNYNDSFQVSVIEDNYVSDDELLDQLQSDTRRYQLIVATNYAASAMIERGLFAPLDPANVPNLANLASPFRNLSYDPGNQYCAPYLWGALGLGYLSNELSQPLSWADVYQPSAGSPALGRATLMEHRRESLAAALIALGYSANSTSNEEIEAAGQLLRSAANLNEFDSKDYAFRLASTETVLAQGWNWDFAIAQDENLDLAFAIPPEGSLMRVFSLCIPVNTTPAEKQAAERFINYVLLPEVSAEIVNYTLIASTVVGAQFLAEPYIGENSMIFLPEEILARLQYAYYLGPIEARYLQIWSELAP